MKRLKRNREIYRGVLLPSALFGTAVGIFLYGVTVVSGRAGREEAESLRSAIARASIQCYAIEGRYPPSVSYLEESYGIQIDRTRYDVFYEGFASNIMPDITVVPRTDE